MFRAYDHPTIREIGFPVPGVVGLYGDHVRELLSTGKLPVCFEEYAGFVTKYVIPRLPEEARGMYERIVEIGVTQAKYLRCRMWNLPTKGLEDTEAERIAELKEFVAQLGMNN